MSRAFRDSFRTHVPILPAAGQDTNFGRSSYHRSMRYIVLLRGINVGGNNKVNMTELKTALETAGFQNVTTYINSGNILLDTSVDNVAEAVEEVIELTFGFLVYVIALSKDSFLKIAKALPADWTNDTTMKTDVMFLWQDVDNPEIIKEVTIKPELDRVLYVPGALLWSVDRPNITRSGMLKLVGTDLYKRMTIRNCNTVRKLATFL